MGFIELNEQTKVQESIVAQVEYMFGILLNDWVYGNSMFMLA